MVIYIRYLFPPHQPYVWDKAKENRTTEKTIYVDEMWQLIGSTGNRIAAEFVLEIFKIIRGYGGSAICGT